MRFGVLLAVVVGAAAPANAGPHPGRVVRVERAARRPSGVPRMCIMSGATGGVCLGPSPKLGDEIRLIGPTHLIGSARITQLHSVTACGEDPSLAWQVTTEPDGPIDPDGPNTDGVGVLDVTSDPHAHLVDASTPPGVGASGFPARAIDTDGDGTLDIEFTVEACEDGGNARAMCIDVWTSTDGHTLQRFRRDAIAEGC